MKILEGKRHSLRGGKDFIWLENDVKEAPVRSTTFVGILTSQQVAINTSSRRFTVHTNKDFHSRIHGPPE